MVACHEALLDPLPGYRIVPGVEGKLLVGCGRPSLIYQVVTAIHGLDLTALPPFSFMSIGKVREVSRYGPVYSISVTHLSFYLSFSLVSLIILHLSHLPLSFNIHSHIQFHFCYHINLICPLTPYVRHFLSFVFC